MQLRMDRAGVRLSPDGVVHKDRGLADGEQGGDTDYIWLT